MTTSSGKGIIHILLSRPWVDPPLAQTALARGISRTKERVPNVRSDQ
jgi:hypothetical protein